MLSTSLTRLLGIAHPIIQAGMGNDCGWEIAAAVSNAGGLGTIGSIGRSPRELREQIARCRAETARPFAVNVVGFDWAPFAGATAGAAIEAGAPCLTISFGDFLPALRRCQQSGVPAIIQVQSWDAALTALEARPSAIIVQGSEAGGHTGQRGTLNFAAQVLDAAGDTPVILAGGVGNGRGLAAALAMGAGGVVMGTRFKASREYGLSAPHGEAQKEAIIRSDGGNTVFDPINDIAYGMDWPEGIFGRALANEFTREWLGRPEELRAAVAEAGQPFGFVARLAQSPDTVINWAGESSALVHDVLPAAEIVSRTVAEAEQLLDRVAAMLRSASSTR
jgi:NAD(P)H-dependent flavin oxidoreductase YrpB (nitropropane dioxygenase family)